MHAVLPLTVHTYAAGVLTITLSLNVNTKGICFSKLKKGLVELGMGITEVSSSVVEWIAPVAEE